MIHSVRPIRLAGFLLASPFLVPGFAGAQKRPVSVLDLIHTARIVNAYGSGIPAEFSRDRRQFVFAVERANLEQDAVIGSLLRFRSDDVWASPRPDTLVSFTSTSNHHPIADPQWLGDTAIVFLAEGPGRHSQVHLLDVRTRKVRVLTTSPTRIKGFTLARNGSRFVYLSDVPVDTAANRRLAVGGFLVNQDVRELLQGNWSAVLEGQFAAIGMVTLPNGRETPLRSSAMANCYQAPTVSPTGRYALFDCYYSTLPAELAPFRAWMTEKAMNAIQLRVVADLDQGQVWRLMESPAHWEAPMWSPDGSAVLVINNLLPPDALTAEERTAGGIVSGAMVVDVATRKVSVVSRGDSVTAARWSDAKTVVLRGPKDSNEVSYRSTGTSWMPVASGKLKASASVAPASPAELQISVEQTLGSPPRVIATKGNQRAVIYDPNPELAKLTLGKTEVLRWRSAEGEWEGGVYYPVGYQPGTRYPLVVQTHGFDANTFDLGGYNCNTGYAAQVLAGQGIVVLQFGMPLGDFQSMNHPDEVAFDGRGIEAAIDTLVARGIVDPAKIALQGWSRSTWVVRYILALGKHPIAAALISDGVDYGYLRYLIEDESGKADIEFMNKGMPIGDGLTAWRGRVPTLNADKITTPLRIESISYQEEGGGPLTQWELYSLLQRLGRPVEMIYYPRGVHDLVHPQERLTSQGGAVDWFLFWLKGTVDPDSAKAAQYRRWRAMKG